MSLVEIARYTDVYEADLAAAFLASRNIEVSVTERFQTTVDPLMQRALGIRLMAYASDKDTALDLLERARLGEFTTDEDEELDATSQARWAGRGIALFGLLMAGYPATSLPRTLRPVQVAGMVTIITIVGLSVALWFWVL